MGNWGGSRTNLSNSGLDLEFTYTGEIISYIGGGVEKGNDYSDNIDLTATFNLEKLLAWKGATLFAYVLGNHGGIVERTPGYVQGVSNRAGAIQGISNIAAYSTWKLYEIWLEQKLFGQKLSLLAGLFDLNSEFDVQETSGIFLNPSFGIGAEYAQTGENGPSIFPTTSVALRINFIPNEHLYFNLAIFDGIPGDPDNPNGTRIKFGKNDGLLIAYEMGLFGKTADFTNKYSKYSLGAWYYTKEFEDLTETVTNGDPLKRKNNFGIYFSAEKFLFAESDESEGLAGFIRAGFANSDINLLDYYWGFGLTYYGPFSGRDDDVFGFAFATAHNGNKFREIANDYGITLSENEYVLEVTYSFKAARWFRIQPDFQYVINPVASTVNKHASVVGIRCELIF